MKHLLLAAILLYSYVSHAQSGHGIVYDYTAGFRTDRRFDPNAPLAKSGQTSDGKQADTLIFNNVQTKPQVRFFPNPATDILIIEDFTWQFESTGFITVYDLLGRELLKKTSKAGKETIDVSKLIPGDYIVNYYINNSQLISCKFSKL